jgi:ribonuclease HI
MQSIFSDGSSRGNGQRGAFGGWAWAYWDGPIRGLPLSSGSAPLPASPTPTNQRAELTALLEALRWLSAQGVPSATVYTDSNYAIQCASKWGPGWKKAGWKRSSGEPLQNLDLVKPLVDIWKPKWRLQHVYGHQKGDSEEAYGNNWVDRAAVEAASGSSVMPQNIVSTGVASPIVSAKAPRPFPSEVEPKKVMQQDIRHWFGVGS